MRLLYVDSDGRLCCTKDYIVEREIPPYAILSHTWNGDQEVTFADVKHVGNVENITAQHDEGYRKIRFCAQQAKRDNLHYFWVDTCCIDKSNHAELSKAINSMFRWYQNADKCYVYLADVKNGSFKDDDELVRRWKPSFRKSRWFTRGWTLQELLAPKTVEFYSADEVRLGDKISLRRTISETTGIPEPALAGSSLFGFEIDERFTWAANRHTTQEEDEAYCLQGLFGIHLPLLYGEGKENAHKRLRREIRQLQDDDRNGGKSSSTDQAIRPEICRWLAAPNPYTNYRKALTQRQTETGLWFLESDNFLQWKTGPASLLWLSGIAGSGKTILGSTIIENLQQHYGNTPGTVIVYFYFDFKDTRKQDPKSMLRSLLYQVLQQISAVPHCLNALYLSCKDGQQQVSLHALLEVAEQTIKDLKQIYVVLDALDECKNRAELLDVLKMVAGWRLRNLHLLMTSRKEPEIESSLETYVDAQHQICLQSDLVDKDISLYVQHRLSSDKSLIKWSQDIAVRQEIEAALMRGAHGMFRWATCQLDALRKCRNRSMLRKALATLPPTLDQTYDRILCAISEADSKYAMRILRWLVCSIRPLCVEEVAEAVAIDTSRSPAFDPDEILEDPLDVLSICGGLVTLTTTSKSDLYDRPFNSQRIVALAHYSVQEYLVSDQIRQGEAKRYSLKADAGHNAITQDCLHYLLQFQQPNMRPSDIIDKFALSRYSATFMQYHIQRAKHKIKQSNRLVLDFFSSANPAYENWIQLHDHLEICDDGRLSVEGCAMPRPLSCAAITAMRRVVEILLDAGAKVNEDHESVLQAAVIGEHEEIVKMLLDKGANVNDTFPGDRYDNVLHAAIWGYNENMVKMLLDAGADPNAQSGYYGNVLQYAVCECVKGDDIIVKLLLGKGANVNAQGGHFGYALQAGSWFGHEPIVELLLDEGAKVNAQGGEYGNALQAASHNGHERIVKTLLDKGAKVNAQGGRYGNALQAASSEGHGEIVEILLRKGARVNAQGGKQGNALQAAIVGGHEQVVKMLIEAGAENKETIVTAPIT